jgi:PAS domain S-box-containing protein
MVNRLDDGLIINTNEGFSRIFGYSKEEVVGKSVFDLNLYKFPNNRKKFVNILHEKGFYADFEETFLRKDGSELIGRMSARTFTLDGVLYATNNLHDITEETNAKKASDLNTERFISLFDNMSSGAAIYKVVNNGSSGKHYIIQDFNKVALIIENKPRSEVIGKSLIDLRPNIDSYGLISVFQRVWLTGVPEYFPSKIYIDESYSNWYENRVFRLNSGEIVAIYDDVTERMQITEKLKDSELKYRQITENMSDVVWTTDLNLKTTFISSSVEKLLRETAEEHKKKSIEKKIPPEYINMVNSILYEEFEKEKSPDCDKDRSRIIELEHYRGDGIRIWVSMHIKFLRDENDKILRIYRRFKRYQRAEVSRIKF